MIARFCTYAVLRNLRIFDPFFMLFLLMDLRLSYVAVGALLAYEKVLTGALEVPLGAATDALGRRRMLTLAFVLLAGVCVLYAQLEPGASLVALYGAQTVLAVSEALRTGTHKAMILDWLTQQNRRAEATRVISLARFFSKTSAGASALLAGGIVYATGGVRPLFWVALGPAVATAVLIASYPRSLDGGMRTQGAGGREASIRRLIVQFKQPALWSLISLSVLFETQIKLAMHFLQPYLEGALGAAELSATVGIGALLYGSYHFIAGLLAGASAFLAVRLPQWFGGARPALWAVYLSATVALLGVALGGWLGWTGLGVGLMWALAALQNARRPLFVATLDAHMEPQWRATTLSVESQMRRWVYAATALGAGWLAEVGGPALAFAGMAGLMLIGALFGVWRRLAQRRLV